MSKRASILHLTPFFSPNVGGVETHLDDLLGYLISKKFKSFVLTYQALVGSKRGKQKEISRYLEIYRISWIPNLYYKTLNNPFLHFLYLTPWLLINTINLLIKRGKEIDIIHAHGINAGFIGATVKKIFKKPLIVSMYVEFHFSKNDWLTKFYIWPLKTADKILVMTERSKIELIEHGINVSKVNIYSHWVNQDMFKPRSKMECRRNLGWENDRFTVLFVGRLIKEKGIYLVLNMAKNLPNIFFVLIASGELSGIIEKAASKLKNIKYLGRVDYNKLAIYYTAADILIVPSLALKNRSTFEEGIPRVIMEALSCGTPIIGTDNGGIKEVVETGQVGFIVPSTAEDFIEILRKLLKDPIRLEKMRRRCLDYARRRFNIKGANIIANTYQQIYATQN